MSDLSAEENLAVPDDCRGAGPPPCAQGYGDRKKAVVSGRNKYSRVKQSPRFHWRTVKGLKREKPELKIIAPKIGLVNQ